MVKLNLLNLTPVTGTLTVYAKLNTPQTTAVPGNYQDSYTAATATVTLNPGLVVPPTTCGDTVAARLPFLVSANVTKQCAISYANNIIFNPSKATDRNVTANSALGVACTNNTPIPLDCSPLMGIRQVMAC